MSRTALATLGIMLAIFAAIATVLWLSTVTHLQFGSSGDRGITRMNLIVTLFAAGLFAALTTALAAIGVSDVFARRPVTPLFWPLCVKAVSFLVLLTIAAINAVDLLSHDLVPRWSLVREPEVRVLVSLTYLGFVAGFGWFLAELLRGHGWGRRDVAALFGGICAAVALCVAIIAVRSGT